MKDTQLVKAIDSASHELLGRAATAVNQSHVIRNWPIGAYIVEFEQRGEDRAKYGEMLLARLSCDLKQRGVKGASRDILERMRTFFAFIPPLFTPSTTSCQFATGGGAIFNCPFSMLHFTPPSSGAQERPEHSVAALPPQDFRVSAVLFGVRLGCGSAAPSLCGSIA